MRVITSWPRITVATALALAVAASSASAASLNQAGSGGSFAAGSQQSSAPQGERAQLSDAARAAQAVTCDRLVAGEVQWYALDEEEEYVQVESYPSDAKMIYPWFKLDCIPKKTTIITILSYNDEQVGSRKDSLKPTDEEAGFGASWKYDEDSEDVFADGTWTVDFYSGNELLVSGSVVVGEDVQAMVTVMGTVKDGATKKAIPGALVIVLNSGVTAADWLENDEDEDDVYASAETDRKGRFILEEMLERDTEYSFVVRADGYETLTADEYVLDADAPDPSTVNITLERTEE